MLRKCNKLNQYTALLSVVLALLPVLQQTHAICRIAGCMDPVLASSSDASVAQCASCSSCNGHDSNAPCNRPMQSRNTELPCGPYCVCTQAPEPREAPRPSSSIAQSGADSQHMQTNSYLVIEPTAADLMIGTSPSNGLARTSGDSCERLCRFLI